MGTLRALGTLWQLKEITDAAQNECWFRHVLALQSAILQVKFLALAHIDIGFFQKQLPQDTVESFQKKIHRLTYRKQLYSWRYQYISQSYHYLHTKFRSDLAVGIEMWRAHDLGQWLPMYPPFPAAWQMAIRPWHHVSTSPPAIPDGGFFPVRF